MRQGRRTRANGRAQNKPRPDATQARVCLGRVTPIRLQCLATRTTTVAQRFGRSVTSSRFAHTQGSLHKPFVPFSVISEAEHRRSALGWGELYRYGVVQSLSGIRERHLGLCNERWLPAESMQSKARADPGKGRNPATPMIVSPVGHSAQTLLPRSAGRGHDHCHDLSRLTPRGHGSSFGSPAGSRLYWYWLDSPAMSSTQTEPTLAAHIASGGVYRLLVVFSLSDSDVGYSRALAQGPLIIGRESMAQPSLQLRQAQVSRNHARIEPTEAGGFWIRDQNSRNGTYVNGSRVVETELHDGDVIRIGGSLILFQFLDLAACQRVLESASVLGGLVGQSHAIAAVRDAVRAAPAGAPILVLGETGVGKELVAQAIHQHSGRTGPFVPVNCSALPNNLVESELFGHVRGAFTGAEARRGLFGRAEKGTLFLDEIGEIGVDVQAKLLRAVALGEVRPVGSDHARFVDIGIVAATNADLEVAVAEGKFRADLYARLISHIIHVPPLRARKEDIITLTRHFLASAGDVLLTPDAAEALLTYAWPYNVRELQQVLAPLLPAVTKSGLLELRELPPRIRQHLNDRLEPTPPSDHVSVSLLGVRRDAVPTAEELRAVVQSYQGNIAQVASFFRKDRRQVYRWAQTLGVDIQALREELELRTLPPPPSSSQEPEEPGVE
jgi:DNA-binding NtrC family response regulator